MDDDRLAEYRVLPMQPQSRAFQVHARDTLAICLDVSQVADVMGIRTRRAVHHLGRIEVATGAGRIIRATVAMLMDVKSMLAGSKALYDAADVHAVADALEDYRSLGREASGGVELDDGPTAVARTSRHA